MKCNPAIAIVGKSWALAAIAAASLLYPAAQAQAAWQPDRTVEIIVGTTPGSGYDIPARVLQKIWQETKLVNQNATVTNKVGGYNAVGNAYIARHEGEGTVLGITGTLLLSDNLSGNATMSYKDFTPLVVFESEEILFAVPAASPIKNGTDFINALKKDPASLSVGLSGVGGQNHIALGLVAHAGGVDASKLKVVGFQGGAESVTAALGNHVDVVVGPASIIAAQLEGGKLRAIGVPADKRLPGAYANIPTWKEQGINAVFSQWRGAMGPKGMTADQIAYWDNVFAKTVQTKEWHDFLDRSQLGYRYLDSKQAVTFIADQNEQVKAALLELGLIKK